jgi:hypothetical protein
MGQKLNQNPAKPCQIMQKIALFPRPRSQPFESGQKRTLVARPARAAPPAGREHPKPHPEKIGGTQTLLGARASPTLPFRFYSPR